MLTIVFFARKVQKQEQYDAEKVLEVCDLGEVKGLDLNFVEQVTKQLVTNGFRWVDDYKVREKDDEFIKLLRHHQAVGEYYVRYFMNDEESTIASVAFNRFYQKDEETDELECVAQIHHFSLETALKNNKHLQSELFYKPSGDLELVEELLDEPGNEYKVYGEEGQIDEMIEKHLKWVNQSKEVDGGIDSNVMLSPLGEVLKKWWVRAYNLKDDIYTYKKEEHCYKLTLMYCIKVVLCYPFSQLFKCL